MHTGIQRSSGLRGLAENNVPSHEERTQQSAGQIAAGARASESSYHRQHAHQRHEIDRPREWYVRIGMEF